MSNEDPRLKGESNGDEDTQSSMFGLVESCKQLTGDLCEASHLEIEAAKGPIRGIVGTVRNVADFGAFVDIGSEQHGLLHVSMLGPSLQLSQLLIGQPLGVDILSASNGRISLGLHGCNLDRSPPCIPVIGSNHPRGRNKTTTTNGSKRSLSTISDGKRKKTTFGYVGTSTRRKKQKTTEKIKKKGRNKI
jgi:predicted RNA-binding protein with RPS1 domain